MILNKRECEKTTELIDTVAMVFVILIIEGYDYKKIRWKSNVYGMFI